METLHLSIVKANVKNRICASVRRGESQLSIKCICNKLFLLSILVMFSGIAIINGQESFFPTGSMSKNRGGPFTLTRLVNGKILAVGGSYNQAENLATAELYDPATGLWTPTGSMNIARSSHTATLLADGRVLVAGGYGASGLLNSAEIYDPTSGTWSVTGSISEVRASHTAFLLNNGKVLAAAGMYQRSGDTFGKSSAELYDPVSGTWSMTGSLGTARMHQQGVCLSDGRILIAGGQPRGVTSVDFASAEIYNPASGTWTATGSMLTPRRQAFTLTLLSGGNVLVAAGNRSWNANTNNAEIYDPSTGVWSSTTPLPEPRAAHIAAKLKDGKVLVAGGGNVPWERPLTSAVIYDPTSGTWSPTPGTMCEYRYHHRASPMLDGRVLIVGGYDLTNGILSHHSSAELFGEPISIPPVVDAGTNITIFSEEISTTIIEGNATDKDPDDILQYHWLEAETVLLDWTPAGENGECPLALTNTGLTVGTHTLTLEATDSKATASDEMILTIDNSAPHAVATGSGTYEIYTDVTLGGEVSDYDGDVLTYEWKMGDDILYQDMIKAVAGGTPVTLPGFVINDLDLGTHTISLIVNDGINAPVSSDINVEIVDNTQPTLSPDANKNILWPPNHKMVDIIIVSNASDNSGVVTVSASITSNEPQDGLDDDDLAPDWTEPVIDQNTGEITFQLRSERSGSGEGRIYSITVTATDNSDNSSSANVTILVPHDKRKK